VQTRAKTRRVTGTAPEQNPAGLDDFDARLSELEETVRSLRQAGCGFPECCALLLRNGRLSPSLLIPPPRDCLTSAMVETLLARSGLSLSEMSRSLRAERGAGDRKTVRARLALLSRNGIAQRDPATKTWQLSPGFLSRWHEYVTNLTTLKVDRGREGGSWPQGDACPIPANLARARRRRVASKRGR